MYEEIRREMPLQGHLSVEQMCRLADVSHAGFYRYLRGRSRVEEEITIRSAVQDIVLEHRWRYGYRRVTAELRQQGMAVNHKRIARIMHLLAVRLEWLRPGQQHVRAARIYLNLANRMTLSGLNQLWAADITYIRLACEFVYLAVVFDVFSRKVIGWPLGRSLKARLPVCALQRAIANRRPPPGVVHHSDQGVQYACQEYMEKLRDHQMLRSMSRPSNPYDNATCREFSEHVPWLVRRLPIRDWDPAQENWTLPEPIQCCDVAIVMGGGPKTLRAANLCRLAKKPIVPITALKRAAVEVFAAELGRFVEFYEGRVSRDQYSLLDTQNPGDFAAITREAVQLAAQLAVGNLVFIVMAFREELEDAFTAINEVCKERGLKCSRTDQDPTTSRIYQRIVSEIRRATFVIADVTVGTLNVYYELGYAEALGKPVIVIAKEGTDLPFDTRDIPTTLYRNQTRLKTMLGERIDGLVGVNTRA